MPSGSPGCAVYLKYDIVPKLIIFILAMIFTSQRLRLCTLNSNAFSRSLAFLLYEVHHDAHLPVHPLMREIVIAASDGCIE